MSVEITTSSYWGGMPAMDYAIHINGIRIQLKTVDFQNLLTAMSDRLAEDYEKVLKVKKQHDNNIDKLKELRKDLIKLFYEGDTEDMYELFIRRDIKDIDDNKLSEVLEKHSKFLGFE
ncbi:hypothetical protein [Flavobacterium cerinum]|uniref:Uncharacterized protein n=1 Tax=Flavobacterium cerinum TaxID=2502784 RepID=A0A3S3QAK8_9FLAO|nr:hypothetical protein [Flavobacterium cerinum]RWX03383.1 hypothetical protein EPI11_00190 [Flavobacterium cerinum]